MPGLPTTSASAKKKKVRKSVVIGPYSDVGGGPWKHEYDRIIREINNLLEGFKIIVIGRGRSTKNRSPEKPRRSGR